MPIDDVHRLGSALAEAGLDPAAAQAVLDALDAPLPLLPTPLGAADWREAQERALLALESVLEVMEPEVADPTRGWRPLVRSGRRGRARTLTTRHSYTPNVAAG